jgi:hypothetical protein
MPPASARGKVYSMKPLKVKEKYKKKVIILL